jgi:creatinine amidohydrolase
VPHAGRTLIDPEEQRLGLHAGQRETALMLALAPGLVRLDLAAGRRPAPMAAPTLSPDGRPVVAWMAQDLSPDGTIGDPRAATVEQGRAILETLVDSWARAIAELHALRWPPAEPTPPSP